jgi:hypothetical protein
MQLQLVSVGVHGKPRPLLQQTGSPAGQLFWQVTAFAPLQTHVPVGLHELQAVFGCAERD